MTIFQVWYDLPSDVFHTAVSNIDTFLAKMKVTFQKKDSTPNLQEKVRLFQISNLPGQNERDLSKSNLHQKVRLLQISCPECQKKYKSFKMLQPHMEY